MDDCLRQKNIYVYIIHENFDVLIYSSTSLKQHTFVINICGYLWLENQLSEKKYGTGFFSQ